MLVSTCNRVEVYFVSHRITDNAFLRELFEVLYPHWDERQVAQTAKDTELLDGLDAVRHIFQVAGSLDSLVVGEREILSQIRNAFNRSDELGLTGEMLRLTVRKTIETAKRIFTETDVANRPVSVVNLAYRSLMAYDLEKDARFLVVGAGVTNTAMLKKLKKQGYSDFSIYNRTLANAEKLVELVGGKAYDLADIANHTTGFDVVVTCTGASHQVITHDLYRELLGNDDNQKFVVDLAVPNDFDPVIKQQHPVEVIEVSSLKAMAERNMAERKKALVQCESIVDESLADFGINYEERQVELAMREVPERIREIKDKTMAEVFAKRLNHVDDDTRALMNEMLSYMEKKVNAVTMKKAKEIMLQKL